MSLIVLCSVCSVSQTPRDFLTFFPQQLGIFSPNFTHLLNIPIYTGAILTKFCHIKSDHPVHNTCSVCPPSAETLCWHFLTFSPNIREFLVQILHTYYTFLSMLEYKFLSNYLQLRRNYAILSATTQRAFQLMVDVLSI